MRFECEATETTVGTIKEKGGRSDVNKKEGYSGKACYMGGNGGEGGEWDRKRIGS